MAGSDGDGANQDLEHLMKEVNANEQLDVEPESQMGRFGRKAGFRAVNKKVRRTEAREEIAPSSLCSWLSSLPRMFWLMGRRFESSRMTGESGNSSRYLFVSSFSVAKKLSCSLSQTHPPE